MENPVPMRWVFPGWEVDRGGWHNPDMVADWLANARTDGYTRADDLRDTVYWIQRAEADGMNVMGYNYWSLTDNYEWGSYTPHFGMYTVDVLTDPTLTRKPTDAVPAYTAITGNGGVPGDYRPTRDPESCSLVDALASCTDPVTVPR